MDRIIGYKISPFLWKAVIEMSGSSSLSAGRVQSVALKIICDREAEIDKFIQPNIGLFGQYLRLIKVKLLKLNFSALTEKILKFNLNLK